MDTLIQDARYALRTLARSRGFALTAILTLALGIGSTTAIYSVVDAVVLRPLPFPDAERVVVPHATRPATAIRSASAPSASASSSSARSACGR